jgi:hypothetical protein
VERKEKMGNIRIKQCKVGKNKGKKGAIGIKNHMSREGENFLSFSESEECCFRIQKTTHVFFT